MNNISIAEELRSDELYGRVNQLKAELDDMVNDPKTMREAEEFHRRVGGLSYKDLWRRFTI